VRRSIRAAKIEPEDVLRADRTILRWVAPIAFDAERFAELCATSEAAAYDEAFTLYRGDFLEGDFDEWVTAQRERLAAAYEALLSRAAASSRDVAASQTLLGRNPYDEAAYATLIEADLQADALRKSDTAPRSFGAALRQPRVYGLALVYFAFYSMQSVLLIWVPTLLKSAGVTDLNEIGWRAASISLAGTIGMVAIGYSSDRLRERRWHLIGCGGLAALVFMLLPLGAASPNLTTLLLGVAAVLIFAFLGLFWTVPTALLDRKAAAGSIALISSIGASGSALSPAFIGWTKVLTGSFYGAVSSLALLLLVSMALLYWCMSATLPRRQRGSGMLIAETGAGN